MERYLMRHSVGPREEGEREREKKTQTQLDLLYSIVCYGIVSFVSRV